jgi:hypothetical protein
MNVHWPLHLSMPGPQPHTPELQPSPPAQSMPQPPQFIGSNDTFVHIPLHTTSPGLHEQVPL